MGALNDGFVFGAGRVETAVHCYLRRGLGRLHGNRDGDGGKEQHFFVSPPLLYFSSDLSSGFISGPHGAFVTLDIQFRSVMVFLGLQRGIGVAKRNPSQLLCFQHFFPRW